MQRIISYAEAINEATSIMLNNDPSVYIIGLGVPDPKGVFGTTSGLHETYGPNRVLDMPISENAMTGMIIGSALAGKRPILVHQRVEFSLLSFDQLINQAANWSFMSGGKQGMPIVIRMLIGRGWGQGPQHSQSLHNVFASFPGLKVVMPTFPQDAKGLLISAIKDNNPVIYLEHRWLHNIKGDVPEGYYEVPIGEACVVKTGSDVTVIATSYMVLEALDAAKKLETQNISVEVIDLRSINPIDSATIIKSVKKTGRVVIADLGWKTYGAGAEIFSLITENCWEELRVSPLRLGLPDHPTPSSPALAKHYYYGAEEIIKEIAEMMQIDIDPSIYTRRDDIHLDIPNSEFTGPF